MADRVSDRYLSARFIVLLIGVIMIVLAAFGVKVGPMDLFMLGVGVSFGSFLA